jgi:hypothetical protein
VPHLRLLRPNRKPAYRSAPKPLASGFKGFTARHSRSKPCAPGRLVLLLFTDLNCGPCTSLLPEIGRWQHRHAEKLTISLIRRGTPEENRTKSSERGVISVLLQEDWEVSEAYQVNGIPSAVLVNPEGTIGSPLAAGPEAVKALVRQTVGAPDQEELPVQPTAPQSASQRTPGLELPMQPTAQGEPCPNCGKVHAAAPTVTAGREIGEPAPELRLADLERARR